MIPSVNQTIILPQTQEFILLMPQVLMGKGTSACRASERSLAWHIMPAPRATCLESFFFFPASSFYIGGGGYNCFTSCVILCYTMI